MGVGTMPKEVDVDNNRLHMSFEGTHLVPKSVNASFRLPSMSRYRGGVG
jgi:hypothetical protein